MRFLCNILSNGKERQKANVQIIQKDILKKWKFVHTYLREGGTIITVKTPQYII